MTARHKVPPSVALMCPRVYIYLCPLSTFFAVGSQGRLFMLVVKTVTSSSFFLPIRVMLFLAVNLDGLDSSIESPQMLKSHPVMS